MLRIWVRLRVPMGVVLAAVGASGLLGCSNDATPKAPLGAGGSGSLGGSAGSGGGLAPNPVNCESTTITTQKRVVRLTDNQLVNTYTALFKEAAPDMFKDEEISPANLRAFPPLATIGTTIGQSAFDLRDRAAKRAMTYVGGNLATLTTCGATPSDAACGLAAVLKFAESAYRRPLNPDETASYQTLWTELTATNGGSVAEAIQHGYDAVLLSPGFLYRSEVGDGYYNVICDSRVDSYETSTRCLSYGYTKQQIAAASGGGMISENTPLRPTLSPITAYNDLFKDFMPGGGTGMTDQSALRLLKQRKSVLDHSLRELERLKSLAPANERSKIDAHAEVIRKLESQLSDQINNGGTGAKCEVPTVPAMNLNGLNSDAKDDYGNPTSAKDDAPNHAAVGAAHASIIRAAFACDIIRVATFEWSPGTNHVSFKGADPNSPNTIYMHHPLSHRKLVSSFYQGTAPATDRYIWDAMAYVQNWYFTETAKFVMGFLNQKDPLDPAGGSLLDRTVITAVSEVGNPSHDRNDASALIIGGSKLGMQPGGFQSLMSSHHNRIWATAAQAFLGADPLSKLSNEVFYKNGVTPIPGIWAPPPT